MVAFLEPHCVIALPTSCRSRVLSSDMQAEDDEVVLNVEVRYAISREVSAICRRYAEFLMITGS